MLLRSGRTVSIKKQDRTVRNVKILRVSSKLRFQSSVIFLGEIRNEVNVIIIYFRTVNDPCYFIVRASGFVFVIHKCEIDRYITTDTPAFPHFASPQPHDRRCSE